MIKSFLSISLFALLMFVGCTPKSLRYYKQAEYHYTQKEYEFAIQKYKQSIRYGGDSAECHYKIAEAYRRSNRLHEAEEHYSRAIALHVNEEDVYFYHALTMKAEGNYEGAISRLNEYIKIGTNFDLINRAKSEIANLKKLEEIIDKEAYYTIENVKDVNTEEAEYSPVLFNKKLYFTSSRGAEKMHAANGTGFTNIYEYTFDGIGKYTGQATALPELINSNDAHEATAVFSKDGKYMYFAKAYNGEKKSGEEVDLYVSEMQPDGNWGAPVKLPINDDKAWDSNPWLTEDGNTLYFSSNREGGFGNNDLYKATRDKNGVWGNVVNLGNTINTKGNEMFPFELPSNKRLYFSSDGHPSLGALDLFYVMKDKNGKTIVENMGPPINSSYDDFAIYFKDTLEGFFTSNRVEGGEGNDDIYEFKYLHPTVCYVLEGQINGHVKGEKGSHPLPNSVIAVILSDKGDTIKIISTDDKGHFIIKCLDPDTKYTILAYKDEYFDTDTTLLIPKVPTEQLKPGHNEFTTKITLTLQKEEEGMEFTFNNIYYDFDKWDIRADAEVELIKIVEFMTKHPEITIELGSHTDERGSADYNRRLAQKRAQSAVNWIVAKGVEKSRIVAKGYGEDKPFIKNATTDEQHQANRRTTIVVTKIDPNKRIIIRNLSEESQNHQQQLQNQQPQQPK